jgi:hypothetical protein
MLVPAPNRFREATFGVPQLAAAFVQDGLPAGCYPCAADDRPKARRYGFWCGSQTGRTPWWDAPSREAAHVGRRRQLRWRTPKLKEQTENVYENKGQGQEVEELRSGKQEPTASFAPPGPQAGRRTTPRLLVCSTSRLLDFSTLRLENCTNKPGMSMKTKDRHSGVLYSGSSGDYSIDRRSQA